MPDTVAQLLRDLNLQSSKSGISFTGIPIEASTNSKEMLAAQAAGCKYLISLQWIERGSTELMPFPSPVAGINGVPVNQPTEPSHQPLTATPGSSGSALLSYSIIEVPNRHKLASGLFVPSSVGTDRCQRLAPLIWHKIER